MRVNATVLGLVLAAFAAPALAGGSGNDLLVSGFGNDVIERPDALPAALTAAPSADTQQRTFEITFTAQVGTVTPNDAPNGLAATKPIAGPATHAMKGVVPNSTEVVRYKLTNAWPKTRTERPLASPQAEPPTQGSGTYSKTLTFTLSTTTPLDPAARLATPSADASQAQGGGMGAGKANFGDFNLAILPGSAPRPEALDGQGSGASPAGSSKPKEIVVVGSKLDTPVGMAATLPQAGATSKGDGRHMLTSTAHDVDRPIVVGRVPQPVAIPVSPAVPRAAGPTALPAKVEFGAAPALRR